jgi:nitronate monooxygenase
MVPEFGIPERTQQFCDVVCEEGVPVVETAGRSPAPLMPKLKEAGVKVIHKLTSVRHAKSAVKYGVDAVTLIGYGSGGHIGMDSVANFIMIPKAVSQLELPVIAGGGICDGKGFLGAMAMGAEAVLMGTAFFATQECPAHDAIKERLVQTNETETCLLLNSLSNPVRCVKNQLADECLALEEKQASFEEIINTVAGGKGKLAYDSGDAEISPIACGQVVGSIDKIKTVKEVIDDIITEAGDLLSRLNQMKMG